MFLLFYSFYLKWSFCLLYLIISCAVPSHNEFGNCKLAHFEIIVHFEYHFRAHLSGCCVCLLPGVPCLLSFIIMIISMGFNVMHFCSFWCDNCFCCTLEGDVFSGSFAGFTELVLFCIVLRNVETLLWEGWARLHSHPSFSPWIFSFFPLHYPGLFNVESTSSRLSPVLDPNLEKRGGRPLLKWTSPSPCFGGPRLTWCVF